MPVHVNFNDVQNKLPPSARRVYEILEKSDEGLTTKDILSRVDYASRTVRYALKKLVATGLVRKLPYLLDMRQSRYLVPKEAS
jgi:predicted transcriptional regulator